MDAGSNELYLFVRCSCKLTTLVLPVCRISSNLFPHEFVTVMFL